MVSPRSTDAPLFSVILPTRDRPEMLRRAISSVLRQSLRDFELIVVDDGSDPPVGNLPSDPRIRIIRNRSSVGVAQARNLGIEASRGSYLSFLDDDDEYLRSFLRCTYKRLRNSPPEIGASWCGMKLIKYPDDPGARPRVRISRIPKHGSRDALIQDFLAAGTGCGFAIKAGCLRRVGSFNCELKVAEDTDLFLRILENGFLPMALPGVHVICHSHRQPRLSGPNLHPERIKIWEEWMFVQHSNFFDQNPVLKKNLAIYVESLKTPSPNASPHDSPPASPGGRARRLLSRCLAMKHWFPPLR